MERRRILAVFGERGLTPMLAEPVNSNESIR